MASSRVLGMFALVVRFDLVPGVGEAFDALVQETLELIQTQEKRTIIYACHRGAIGCQAEARMRAGPAWDDLDLVFANEVGRPLHPGNFHRRVYKPLLTRAGVPDVRFHDLRHSMATLLYSIGADPQTLKGLLGHSKITTTMDTYTHPVSDVQRAEVNRLGELLAGTEDNEACVNPAS